MAALKLRDRDAILTKEGLIFRVYGYFHPPNGFICDVEYAPSAIFQSSNPAAPRGIQHPVYYKFYADEGLRFVQEKYPHHTISFVPLGTQLVGVRTSKIAETRKPDEEFQRLIGKQPQDALVKTLQKVYRLVRSSSGLSIEDFGVFGSILHGFYHPRFSDLDLIVYGRRALSKIRETLRELYSTDVLRNEFARDEVMAGKRWYFVNYSPAEYLWHQRRKLIYAVLDDEEDGRMVKVEFEPVKRWSEIENEYGSYRRIRRRGWVKLIARVTDDSDAPFIPSIYQIEAVRFLEGARSADLRRILSYVEEFRMQARTGEEVYVEGNLEQVVTTADVFHQVTLTYGPRYYEQTLKVTSR